MFSDYKVGHLFYYYEAMVKGPRKLCFPAALQQFVIVESRMRVKERAGVEAASLPQSSRAIRDGQDQDKRGPKRWRQQVRTEIA